MDSAKCPNWNISRLGLDSDISFSASLPSKDCCREVRVPRNITGRELKITEFPKSAIFALGPEFNSTLFAVKSRWIIGGLWL